MKALQGLLGCLTLCLACGSSEQSAAPMAPLPPDSAPLVWSAAESMDEAAGYLLRHLGDSGRFDYVRRSPVDSSHYNLLRHAGAIYSLLQYHEHKPSPALQAGILRASRYLKDRYLKPLASQPTIQAAFSRPGEESVKQSTAKLGGTGLALLALCGSHALDPSSVEVETLQAMGRFILFMQREDGSFHSKFIEGEGFDPSFESLYYPGEAMLALTALYDVDQDPAWLQASLRSAAYLVRSREGVRKPPADHWMMIASAPLLARYDQLREPPLSQTQLGAHIQRLGQLMLSKQQLDPGVGREIERGALTRAARSTATATRLEGLGALLRIRQGTQSDQQGLRESIRAGLAFLQRCQLKEPGPERGGMPRSCAANAGSHSRDREIRIDYVQHYLSAMLTARELEIL